MMDLKDGFEGYCGLLFELFSSSSSLVGGFTYIIVPMYDDEIQMLAVLGVTISK